MYNKYIMCISYFCQTECGIRVDLVTGVQTCALPICFAEGLIMASLIDTIKAKIDVVDEVGLVVALRKSGKSLQGHCPFHNERTPSFHVFPESQTWRCFGCQEGGDVFTFVGKQQVVDFPEALRYLAEKAGVSLVTYSSPNPERERETNALKERL